MTDGLRRWIREREGTGPLCLVSACLCGIACRYDGKAFLQPLLAQLLTAGMAVAVCPETEGGLSIPRPACEIAGDRVLTKNGEDRTAAFVAGAERSLALAQQHGITLAVLKDKSPSCGSSLIYDGSFSRTLIPGRGITVARLISHGMRVVSEKEYLPVLLALS